MRQLQTRLYSVYSRPYVGSDPPLCDVDGPWLRVCEHAALRFHDGDGNAAELGFDSCSHPTD